MKSIGGGELLGRCWAARRPWLRVVVRGVVVWRRRLGGRGEAAFAFFRHTRTATQRGSAMVIVVTP